MKALFNSPPYHDSTSLLMFFISLFSYNFTSNYLFENTSILIFYWMYLFYDETTREEKSHTSSWARVEESKTKKYFWNSKREIKYQINTMIMRKL